MVTRLPPCASGTPVFEMARSLVQEAGHMLRGRFNTDLKVTHKGRADVVTEVDLQVERFVLERLRRETPDFGVLAEESGKGGAKGAEYTWIVDPLDGTRNYTIGVPLYCVTMALAKGEDVLLGLTYDPTRDELFAAEKGNGASVNGTPIRVSRKTGFEAAVIGTDMGYNDAMASFALRLLDALWPGMQGIRIMGSAALGIAYAASGRIDLYFHHQLSPWDIAAGVLIAREAGGIVTDRNGQAMSIQNPTILVSNSSLHAEFLRRTEGLPWRTSEG